MAKNIRLVTRSGEIGYPKTIASQVENLDNVINTAIGSALQSANYVNESTVDSKIAAIEYPVNPADVAALKDRVAALEGAEFPTDIPATTDLANNKTYSLKFTNGELKWVKDDFIKFAAGIVGTQAEPLTAMVNEFVDLGISASSAYSVVSSDTSKIVYSDGKAVIKAPGTATVTATLNAANDETVSVVISASHGRSITFTYDSDKVDHIDVYKSDVWGANAIKESAVSAYAYAGGVYGYNNYGVEATSDAQIQFVVVPKEGYEVSNGILTVFKGDGETPAVAGDNSDYKNIKFQDKTDWDTNSFRITKINNNLVIVVTPTAIEQPAEQNNEPEQNP